MCFLRYVTATFPGEPVTDNRERLVRWLQKKWTQVGSSIAIHLDIHGSKYTYLLSHAYLETGEAVGRIARALCAAVCYKWRASQTTDSAVAR